MTGTTPRRPTSRSPRTCVPATTSFACVVAIVSAALLAGCVAERGVVVGVIDGGETALAQPVEPQRRSDHTAAKPQNLPVQRRGTPLLIAQPSQIAVKFVQIGKTVNRSVMLKNPGTAQLRIERMVLTGSDSFSVRPSGPTHWTLSSARQAIDFDPPLTIDPGGALPLMVRYKSALTTQETAVLRVLSNDPTREIALAVPLRGNIAPACLKLSPAKVLDFGHVDIGTCRTRIVDARNCGDVPVVLQQAGFVKPKVNTPFSVSWGTGMADSPWVDQQLTGGGNNAVLVDPGQKHALAVTYCPAKAPVASIIDSEVLTVIATAPGINSVLCRGQPKKPSCPKAVAGISQGEMPEVGKSMQLTAHDSLSAKGVINAWSWTMQAPPSSNAKLYPSAKVRSPTVKLDVAGSYTFCVDVWDSKGRKSCHPSCFTAHVNDVAAYGTLPVW